MGANAITTSLEASEQGADLAMFEQRSSDATMLQKALAHPTSFEYQYRAQLVAGAEGVGVESLRGAGNHGGLGGVPMSVQSSGAGGEAMSRQGSAMGSVGMRRSASGRGRGRG